MNDVYARSDLELEDSAIEYDHLGYMLHLEAYTRWIISCTIYNRIYRAAG